LVEIFINKLNQLGDKVEDEKLAYEALKSLSDVSEDQLNLAKNHIEIMEDDRQMIQDEFKSFMQTNKVKLILYFF